MYYYILQNGKGGAELPKKDFTDKETEKHKKALGKLIKKCRGKTSLRKFTQGSVLCHSNLQSIEKGINAPTPEAYEFLLNHLEYDNNTRKQMDDHYMAIRKAPPPDVCKTVIQTDGFVAALREFNGQKLTDEQAKRIKSLFISFADENKKGETENAKNI